MTKLFTYQDDTVVAIWNLTKAFKVRRVFLYILISFLAQSASANEACRQRYEYAKEQCRKTKAVCLQSKACMNIRKKCSQDVTSMEGCENFNQCMASNSPTFFPSTCRYTWNGQPNDGKCLNKNMEHEKVVVICPGKQPSLTPYKDEDFVCQAQVEKFEKSQRHCRWSVVNYYKKCMSDIHRDSLVVPNCPGGEKPLDRTTEVITSENKREVNSSRVNSKRARTEKERKSDEKTLEILRMRSWGK